MLIVITHLNISSLGSSKILKCKGIMILKCLRTSRLENLALILYARVITKDLRAKENIIKVMLMESDSDGSLEDTLQWG